MADPTHAWRDHQAIVDLMTRYALSLDDRDFATLRDLFDPDVMVEGFAPETLHGLEAWMAFVARALEGYARTQHMLGPALVEIDGDAGRATTELRAEHWSRANEGEIFTLWGSYRTGLVRTGAGWRIARHAIVIRATRTT